MKPTSSPPTRKPDDDDFVEVVIRVPRASLAALVGVVATPAPYTSKNLPPAIASSRSYREHVRSMPGARRVGRDWVIDVGDWNAGLAATRRAPKATKPIDPPRPVDDVDTLLAGGGVKLRAVGGRR